MDIRIDTTLPRHKKFKKLKRLIGNNAMEHLVSFWIAVAEQVPDGMLVGWSIDDIEDAAGFSGSPGLFAQAMLDSKFLDEKEEGFYPHDWSDHQPWVVQGEERSNKARFSLLARKNKKKYEELLAAGITTVTKDEYARYTTVQRPCNDRSTIDLLQAPSPSPSPTPNVIKDRNIVSCGATEEVAPPQEPVEKVPYKKIIEKLNSVAGTYFKPSAQETKRHIRARWNEGFRLPDFEVVIESKHAEWSTEAEMVQYIRPRTLFGTKFESYLQAAKICSVPPASQKVKCEECSYNIGRKCPNLSREGFDPSKCGAFVQRK